MNWTEAYRYVRHNNRKTARLMALAWMAVDKDGDDALQSTLLINNLPPNALMLELDMARVRTPSNIAEFVNPPARIFILPKEVPR